jgi:pilus assembly protein CpaE
MTHENGHVTREPIRVFVTGSCDGSDHVCEALAHEDDLELVGVADRVQDATGALAGAHLQVVLHATSASTLPMDELAVIREHTRAPIIVLSSGESSQLLDEALHADVADVMLLPQLPENVFFAIRKATHGRLRLAGDAAATPSRIVTVFSPKGGTGKTVIATSLAVGLAKHEGKRTLLLDLDLQFGDAAIMLGVEPDKTIYDLVMAPGELDSEKLAGYVTHHPTGLEVLPAPLRPEDAELVTEAKIGALLEVARESYDVIVVDTSSFFHGPMLATLDQTDQLLLVCSLDVPTIKNVRLSLQTLELLSFPFRKVHVTLNRANTKVGIKKGDVESALEQKVQFEVPSDREVPIGVNRGEPLVASDPGAEFSRSIREMAKQVLTAPDEGKRKRRLLART